MLVSDGGTGTIESVNSLGQPSTFAVIPNIPVNGGLRQMAFAPANFGSIGGDLLVSVAASSQGGGQFGALYALNSSGFIAATLEVGGVLSAFDPRGMAFTPDGQLLISNATDEIQKADASAIEPEPASVV
jgi:hypothetical protein